MYALKWADGRIESLHRTEQDASFAQFEASEKYEALMADAGLEPVQWNPRVVSVLVWEVPGLLKRILG